MKVNIGKYPKHFNSWNLLKKIFVGINHDTLNRINNSFLIKSISDFVNNIINKRKIDIQIEKHDVWSLDHTLSLIILPALKRFKKESRSIGNVNIEDCPDADEYKNNPEKRWDYILDEMIFAFEHIVDDNWTEQFQTGQSDWTFSEEKDGFIALKEGPNHTLNVDNDGINKIETRISNGLMLFGKYFQHLWT